MKWFFRLLTLGSMVVALSVPFWINQQRDAASGDAPDSGGFTLNRLDPALPGSSERTVFKWQDENGRWHYSDAAPAGTQAQSVTVDTRANIIQSVPVAETLPELAAADAAMKTPRKNTSESPSDDTPTEMEDLLSLDRLKNILQDTQQARQLMEQRNEALRDLDQGS